MGNDRFLNQIFWIFLVLNVGTVRILFCLDPDPDPNQSSVWIRIRNTA